MGERNPLHALEDAAPVREGEAVVAVDSLRAPVAAARLLTGGHGAQASALLALQRSAGNHAIGQAVATAHTMRLLQREKPPAGKTPASKFALPPGKSFQWHRQGMSFVVGDRAPGEFRRSENWLGGARPGNARFVPPPPEAVPAMSDLEKVPA